MKNCKDCNEFMCGYSGEDKMSEYCGNDIETKDKPKDIELEFYRYYICKNDLLRDVLNEYKKWKSDKYEQ